MSTSDNPFNFEDGSFYPLRVTSEVHFFSSLVNPSNLWPQQRSPLVGKISHPQIRNENI